MRRAAEEVEEEGEDSCAAEDVWQEASQVAPTVCW